MECRIRKKESPEPNILNQASPFPDEVLERVLGMVKSRKDRSSVSLVCKEWYNAERWSRRSVFIGNCYSVSPEILTRRFPNIRSVTLKGKPLKHDGGWVLVKMMEGGGEEGGRKKKGTKVKEN